MSPPVTLADGLHGIPVLTEAEARRARREQLAAVLRRTPQEQISSAAHDGRMRQGSLLVMARIRAGRYEALETLLGQIADPPAGEDIELNPVIPFARLRTVHFARFLLHAASPSEEAPFPESGGTKHAQGPPIPPKLLFATDFDGPLRAHLEELLDVAGPGLDRVFEHCEGWPGHRDRRAALRFFRRHAVRTNTFYTSTQRRTVEQIRREDDLRRRIDAYLDEHAGRPEFPTDPVQVRERILRFVHDEPELRWTRQEPGPFPTPPIPKLIRDNLLAAIGDALAAVLAVLGVLLSLVLPWPWAGIFLGLVAGVAAAGGAAWLYLRRLEEKDAVIVRRSVKEHTGRLVRTEDRIIQNEMSSVIYIKEPLLFRRVVLWLVLAFLDFSARYVSVEGRLAGIPSIHFARWVMVDGGRRLVFFSNYDGSWESYLGDFVDKSPNGLTGVWSNCVGFPRARGLTGEGAKHEQLFKAYVRDSQIPTQVWYSAYRWLSVSNINDNSKIRLGLYGAMDRAQAEAWLRRFGGGEKAPASRPKPRPKPESGTAAPAVEVALKDVQGLVARSYAPLRHACYVPVRLGEDAAAARAWLDGVRGRVTPASVDTAAAAAQGWALNVAFTHAGLGALGLGGEATGTFSREFIEGMATGHRRRFLGDTGDADPERWRWGGPRNPVHAMLFLFAGTAERLEDMLAEERARGAAHGVELDPPLESVMLADDKEHFGFHDGIAQPRIAGFKPDAAGSAEKAPPIPAGEVVLGYTNAYGRMPASPAVREDALSSTLFPPAVPDPFDTDTSTRRRDLGRNGSYVVFRTLEQDVPAFWRFVDERAGHDPQERKRLAAKMVGRWPNGAPLVWDDQREPPFDREKADRFLYAASGDQHGARCPLGAHIRRTNPRDGMAPDPAESLKVADRHRLLRRGRAYGAPVADSFDPKDILAAPAEAAGPDAQPEERGLHFICFNTDIARQFEFVQNTWVNGSKFDGLYADPDPVIAPHVDPAAPPHPEQVSNFTVQGCPVRHRVQGLPRFVTMRGGAYLFMPGLNALEYLAKMEPGGTGG
jgi:Dyp-type peroxidase family